MATTQVPARIPERPPINDNASTRSVSWPREKRSTRFTIKLSGHIPT